MILQQDRSNVEIEHKGDDVVYSSPEEDTNDLWRGPSECLIDLITVDKFNTYLSSQIHDVIKCISEKDGVSDSLTTKSPHVSTDGQRYGYPSFQSRDSGLDDESKPLVHFIRLT